MIGISRSRITARSLYVWVVVAAGTIVIGLSIRELTIHPVSRNWAVLAGLTLVASAATLRMSKVSASFSVSDIFSLAAVGLFGPAAGTLNVALDCLAITARLARTGILLRRALFNATAPALAMWAAAHAVNSFVDLRGLAADHGRFAETMLAIGAVAGLFFVLDTGLIALAVAMEQQARVLRVWKEHFSSLWLNFFGGAYAAAVLVLAWRHAMFLAMFGPLPFILYYALKHWLGRIEERVNHLRELQEQQALREQAERALRDREAQLSAIFDNALDGLLVVDDERWFIDANPAACEFLGVPRAKLDDLRFDQFLMPELEQSMGHQWQLFLQRGHAKGEWRIARPGGGHRLVEYAAKANVLPGRHLAVCRDVTERRYLEGELRLAQRMETVGRLAGGIAHDFNNLLQAIIGYNNLVLDRVTGEVREDVLEIERAAERASSLTGRLLAFSRKQVLQPVVVELNQLVGNTERMLGRLLGENIDLRSQPAVDLWPVTVDPTQMEQVLVNLVVNARDAMPSGGRLTIETSNADLRDRRRTEDLDVPAGRYVRIAVTDTGVGMDDSVKAHLFEPFFTTKERGKGTGLGLATVYGIVEQSAGHIRVDSVPGCGTTFRIYLPATDAPDAGDAADTAMSLSDVLARGAETILVAEDEAPVRSFVRRTLERQGYRVIETCDSAEAIAVAAQFRGQIDLLLTDIVMPGMNGRELARTLVAQFADLSVVYMSGYAEEATACEPGTPFLQKPFTSKALAKVVRRVLDTRPSVTVVGA